jgi:hypothetical protein
LRAEIDLLRGDQQRLRADGGKIGMKGLRLIRVVSDNDVGIVGQGSCERGLHDASRTRHQSAGAVVSLRCGARSRDGIDGAIRRPNVPDLYGNRTRRRPHELWLKGKSNVLKPDLVGDWIPHPKLGEHVERLHRR